VPIKHLPVKLNQLANIFYDYPSEKLFVSGVTGTDGKTTVTHFIAQSMQSSGSPAALIGTLGNGLIDKLDKSEKTTPDILSLQRMMAQFADSGASSVSMEVSSHGLDQGRVDGISFDVAILTNLSRDHLDYHGGLEAYKQAKKKLFTSDASKALILNADDALGRELYQQLAGHKQIWLYGMNKDVVSQSETYAYATQLETQRDGMKFMLHSSHGTAEIKTTLIGDFNVYNMLACFCVLLQSGLNFNLAVKRVEKLKTVPGRMEMIVQTNKPTVVIDYAHTPEALAQVLKNIRKHTDGRVICVFGCGGDRDAGKRPLMAQVAEKNSDLVILTSDNPRNEDPALIIDEVQQGISDQLKLIVEEDRARAIQHAIKTASVDDMVLIAGKGHEDYQIIGNKKIAFSDREQALECLEANI
jgi:UDP-N-acetylmuramoyl-L-alanyl-D-glutamate--2,6-diaminopimelate ligase